MGDAVSLVGDTVAKCIGFEYKSYSRKEDDSRRIQELQRLCEASKVETKQIRQKLNDQLAATRRYYEQLKVSNVQYRLQIEQLQKDKKYIFKQCMKEKVESNKLEQTLDELQFETNKFQKIISDTLELRELCHSNIYIELSANDDIEHYIIGSVSSVVKYWFRNSKPDQTISHLSIDFITRLTDHYLTNNIKWW
eukprot:32864_1